MRGQTPLHSPDYKNADVWTANNQSPRSLAGPQGCRRRRGDRPPAHERRPHGHAAASMPRTSTRVRRHGCNPPLHALQLGALLLFLGLVAGCFAFELPLIEPAQARAAVTALYSLVVAALVGLYLKTRWVEAGARRIRLPPPCLHRRRQAPAPRSLAA